MWEVVYNTGSSTQFSRTTYRGEVGWGLGGKIKREATYVYLWLIHTIVGQKSIQR